MPPRNAKEVVEHSALDCRSVLHADHHSRQHGFENARRSEIESWSDLAQILLGRLTALGTRHAESSGKALCIVEVMIAHPGERQVGERHVVVGQSIEPDSIRHSINAASRRQHDALRRAGRSRGVEDDRDVRTFTLPDEFIDLPAKRSVGRKRGAAVFDDIVDCDQSAVIVVMESTRLVINDLMEMWHPVGYGQNLIDLLLILRGDKLHIGMSEDVGKLVSNRIRIDRNRNRAQRLGCYHGPVELRPIGTDDGDRVSWLQSKSLQARGICTYDLGDLGPGPRLPDTKILMPKRRTAAKLRSISQKQLGERVKRSATGHVGLHPKTGTLVRACL